MTSDPTPPIRLESGAHVPPAPLRQTSPAARRATPHGERVVIVGAGLCGVYLAYRLSLANPRVKVHVVERSDQTGGRMKSRVIEGLPGVIELGASRFNRRNHPCVAALVGELGIAVEPFSIRPPPLSDASSTKELLGKVLAGSDRSTWHELPFLELCRARLTPDELDAFLATQGYDILLEPTLPTSEAVRILDDHPETARQGSAWLQFQTGFQELTRRVHQEAVSAGATFAFDTCVVRVARLPSGGVAVHTADGSALEADRAIVTAPPSALAHIDLPLSDERRHALASVRDVPMMKAAFGFAESWWNAHGLANDTFLRVQNPLRKVYLRSRQLHVYTDSSSAEYWRPLCERGAVESGLLWRSVARPLREALALSSDVVIPEPTHHIACYWPAGVHAWKLGVIPEVVQRILLGTDDCVHVCSEAFSPSSGWGEAALLTANLLLEALLPAAETAEVHT